MAGAAASAGAGTAVGGAAATGAGAPTGAGARTGAPTGAGSTTSPATAAANGGRAYAPPATAQAQAAGQPLAGGLQTPSFREADFQAEVFEARYRQRTSPVSAEQASEAVRALPESTQRAVGELVAEHGAGAREHLAYQATGEWTAGEREALRTLAAATPGVRAHAVEQALPGSGAARQAASSDGPAAAGEQSGPPPAGAGGREHTEPEGQQWVGSSDEPSGSPPPRISPPSAPGPDPTSSVGAGVGPGDPDGTGVQRGAPGSSGASGPRGNGMVARHPESAGRPGGADTPGEDGASGNGPAPAPATRSRPGRVPPREPSDPGFDVEGSGWL